jgi:hypothetical protein
MNGYFYKLLLNGREIYYSGIFPTYNECFEHCKGSINQPGYSVKIYVQKVILLREFEEFND